MKEKSKGITLVALVVTIVVLLILAGITISTLFGDNGIITAAREAANRIEESDKDTEDKLKDLANKLEEEINGGTSAPIKSAEEYLVDIKANLSKYKSEAQKLGQTTDQNIGIGTDGKVANLDLWYYIKTDDGTGMSLGDWQISDKYSGYRSKDNIVNGKIKGKVPQYIYNITEDKIYSITAMYFTFGGFSEGIEELKYAPEIPPTVTNMLSTFVNCTGLITAPTIPLSVTYMNCTFYGCTKLQGDLVINASPTSYDACLYNAGKDATSKLYLSGSSTKLNEILATKGESTNIEIKQ